MVPDNTKLEAQTREDINAKLDAAGWVVHHKKNSTGMKNRVSLSERWQINGGRLD